MNLTIDFEYAPKEIDMYPKKKKIELVPFVLFCFSLVYLRNAYL